MSQWFICFLFYSLGGYGLEKLHARLSHSPRQVRKCFLILPLCPVYGLAMVLFIAAVPEDTGFFARILLGGMICTGVEYLVHLFYDKALGVWFWDYTAMRGNFHGRVCPHFTIIWGFLSAVSVRIFQPLVILLAQITPAWITYALWLVLAADCVLSAALLRRFRNTELLTVSAVSAQIRASSQSSTSL